MSVLNISQEDVLKQASIQTVQTKPRFMGLGGQKEIVIGPMNARLDFSEIPRPTMMMTAAFSAAAPTLPDTWSWRPDQIDEKHDVDARLAAKQGISPILDQGGCGSCWAFALSAAINDVFAVSGKFIALPDGVGTRPTAGISPTSLMSCFKDRYTNKCSGGSPASAALYVQQNGVWTSPCFDYSWFYNNPNFSQEGLQHFGSDAEAENAMNNAAPTCGCAETNTPRTLFKLRYVNTLPAFSGGDGSSPEELDNTWNAVRSWIWNYGPVVAGYLIYANFIYGDFSSTDGVYFEDATTYRYRAASPKSFMGFHAVKVVGWGIQKNCRTPTGVKDVRYWVCANSWSSLWGADSGYFKIACYPHNKVSQFDVLLKFSDNSSIGGFLVFQAGDIIEAPIPKVSSQYLTNIDKQRLSAGFYGRDVTVQDTPPVAPRWEEPSKPSDNFGTYLEENIKKYWYYVLIGAIILVVGLYFMFRKPRTVTYRTSPSRSKSPRRKS